LVKIHWRMLILDCSQGCYVVKIWPGDLDLWPWKSIGFQILLRTKYVPSLVKIHWRMLILECSQGYYVVKIWPGDLDLWPMTLKINTISLRNFVGEGIIKVHHIYCCSTWTKLITHTQKWVCVCVGRVRVNMVFNANFNNIDISVISWRSVSLVVKNWSTLRKPPTCCKSLANFIT
jgi:hypothetical protein